MLTFTNHTLEKLELLLTAAGYRVRYERGNFKSGSCLLQHHRMVVINKFSDLESRIRAIAALIRELTIDAGFLDDKQTAFLNQLKQTQLAL